MVANREPRFTGKSNVTFSTDTIVGTAANTDRTLATGTTYIAYLCPTDGAIVEGVHLYPQGTNVATVAALYLNNGSAITTPANNRMIQEITCPASTASNNAAIPPVWIPVPRPLWDIPEGYRLVLAFRTATAAGFHAVTAASQFAEA